MPRLRLVLRSLAVLGLVGGSALPTRPALASVPAAIVDVAADAETVPVGTSGDSADDPAIWVDTADPARSIVIGNDKGDALEVYDLAGALLQRIAEPHGNVDVRPGFPLAGGSVDIAAATRSGLRIYGINPVTRALASVTDGSSLATNGGEGLCLYRSAASGRFYVFQVTRAGGVQQWWLQDADADGLVDGQLVRSFEIGSESEGCVADDDLGHVYISEEDTGIWKYGAEPDAGSTRSLVDSVASGRLVSDVEGLAIVRQSDGSGFLLASAQNVADPTASYFTAYQRTGGNAYAGAFRIVTGLEADGCSRTDGIDATASGLGAAFPGGLFVCQDDSNTTPGTGNQNFKFVRLEKILAGLDTGAPPGPDTTPPETTITGGPSGSVTISSATLSFSANEAGSTFACSLDGAAPAPCTAPVTYSDLGLGDHRFEVAATDTAGNTDATPAVRTWTRVEAAPGPLTLLPTDDARVAQSTPNTNYGNTTLLEVDGSPVVGSYLRFDVQADAVVTRARLRLFVTDATKNGPEVYRSDPDWSEATITWNNRPTRIPDVVADIGSARKARYVEWDVSSAVTGPGFHSFELVADSSDALGVNASEASANRPQLVVDLAPPSGPDTTPPETSITAGPAGTVSSTTASFSFSANEPATFSCRLDGGAAEACASPRSYDGLADGPHHFEVSATDTAGNTDATPAERDWTIDSTVPEPPALGTITTLAGTGGRGAAGDGGPATSGQLSAPRTTATDSAGNTFVTDTENHRIRRISAAGIITTIAGTGTAGYGGDGGPATAAQLNNPHGIDVDAAGNVYVADSANQRIRRISPSGVITTLRRHGEGGVQRRRDLGHAGRRRLSQGRRGS
ncbi:MAG TPA: phytase [Acidimicrobiia bacterium]|nr:phytase [Acidimicrobiia bacterium]